MSEITFEANGVQYITLRSINQGLYELVNDSLLYTFINPSESFSLFSSWKHDVNPGENRKTKYSDGIWYFNTISYNRKAVFSRCLQSDADPFVWPSDSFRSYAFWLGEEGAEL